MIKQIFLNQVTLMDKLLLLEILSNDPNFVFRLARVSESAFVVIEISYISLQCRNYCFAE